MLNKEVLLEFRQAPWSSREDLTAFVQRLGRVDPPSIKRLLSVLTDPHLISHGALHRNRCSAFNAICNASLSPEIFAPLADALPEADPNLRRIIASILPKVNDVDAHQALCRQLGSTDPELRAAVTAVLSLVGGPSALTHLTKLVRARHFAGRREAMDVMVARARHRAIPLLEAVLLSGSVPERIRALQLLSEPEVARDHEGAVAAVRSAFDSTERRVSTEAFKAFGRLVSEEAFFDELESHLYADGVDAPLVQSLGSYRSERALAVLDHKIRVGPNVIRSAAIEALAEMAFDGVVPILVTAVHVPDFTIRRQAAEVLAELSQRGKVDIALTIVELLRSTTDDVRRIGAHLARSANDPDGKLAGRLLSFLTDRDWWVRERVMDALVEMMGPALTPHLVSYLSDESAVIRRFAIGGLIRTEDPDALGAILRSAAEDEDWWVREQAVLATASLQDRRAIPYLKKLAIDRSDLRLACIDALKLLGADDELLALAELAGDDDRNVRLAVVRMLATQPRGREAAFYVESLVEDEDAEVGKEARELLQQWQIKPDDDGVVASLGVLDRLLAAAVRMEADDLMLWAGRVPHIKRLNETHPISKGKLSDDELWGMLSHAMGPALLARLKSGFDADFSYEVKSYDLRFRVNVFQQHTGLAAVFRHIKQDLPDIDGLGLPEVVKSFGFFANGLVLIGGRTGSGHSTTLAALIHYINQHSSRHIVTIEDPIEVVHPQIRCLINQREVGTHTPSFESALRSTLRQDPDVILVGELRDIETIEFAVNAAETGHLVFGTVHTASADTTLDRIVHAFPVAQQHLARTMLAESLRAVLCQQLLRRIDEIDERVLAVEVMISNDAIANLIRKNKSFQIPSVIATHREVGMQLLDDQLERLVKRGMVAADEALMRASDKASFANMLVTSGHMDEESEGATRVLGGRTSEAPPARASEYPQVPDSAPTSLSPEPAPTKASHPPESTSAPSATYPSPGRSPSRHSEVVPPSSILPPVDEVEYGRGEE